MSYQLPLKTLIQLNIVISLLLSALVTVFVLAFDSDRTDTVYRFFQSLLFTSAVSFSNMRLLARRLEDQKKQRAISRFMLYLCSYSVALLAWFFVVSMYSMITGKRWEGENGTIHAYFLGALAISCFNTVILVIQNLLILQYRAVQDEVEKLQLKANISETTNLLLRQQIQPHFLFNALATVKSLYKKDSILGEQYLVHLATFLRVSVSNPKKHLALVKDEVAFCLNYLKMQKIRFGAAVEYDIQLDEVKLNKGYLPYFSLQPLAENALKHNDLTEENPIRINIYEENGFIVVSNNLQQNPHKEESAGNGLYNLKERYLLLGEDEIKITTDEHFFRVYLKILTK
jgi:LytS/YehU family sensor histidine kinase